MSNRTKGRKNEYRARDILLKMGYAVFLTPMPQRYNKEQDIFGLFDLVAIRKSDIRLVQVKTNSRGPVAKRNAIAVFSAPPCVSRELWVFRDRVKEPEVYVLSIADDAKVPADFVPERLEIRKLK